MDIGRAVKLCRSQKGWTLRELAKRTGIGISHLSMVERNQRDASMSVMQALANAFGMPLNVLIFLAADPRELTGISNELKESSAMPHSNCSVCQPPTSCFSRRPIGTVAALAGILHHPVAELDEIAATADDRYRIGSQQLKTDGTWRICYDALGLLKSIQARIQCLILNQVNYPGYLQGSIKDRQSPRGQKANACLHTRKRVLISEDIKQFFPNISSTIVFDIWHRFFRFPPTVADLLTKLTTLKGSVPQGAKTSALLANLVFWEHEWRLVANLQARGITYSRLMDDITCSSGRDLAPAELTGVITDIHAMVRRKGLRLNDKQDIARAGDRKVATKLVVNAKTALTKEKRSAIRAAVGNLSVASESVRSTPVYHRTYSRISGQVAYLTQHHPGEGAQALAKYWPAYVRQQGNVISFACCRFKSRAGVASGRHELSRWKSRCAGISDLRLFRVTFLHTASG